MTSYGQGVAYGPRTFLPISVADSQASLNTTSPPRKAMLSRVNRPCRTFAWMRILEVFADGHAQLARPHRVIVPPRSPIPLRQGPPILVAPAQLVVDDYGRILRPLLDFGLLGAGLSARRDQDLCLAKTLSPLATSDSAALSVR